MAHASGDRELCRHVRSKLGRDPKAFKGSGRVIHLLGDSRFDEIHALSAWDANQTARCWKINEDRVSIHPRELRNEHSFDEAFNVAKSFLETQVRKDDELSFFLTLGTHAMVASLLILGKTRFPAKFYCCNRHTGNSLVEETIPFDLATSGVADRLRNSDSHPQKNRPSTQSPPTALGNLVGSSRLFKEAVAFAEKAAKCDVDVLLLGESGTGKEQFAGGIHRASRRGDSGQPFVAINCAAIPESLFESELFGSLPGAFTGATTNRHGAFKRADGGTLFLDEVGELSPANQAKLLRALQPITTEGPCVRLIQPVGVAKESEHLKVDVRVIAATNRDLISLVREGTFRADLLYRLGAVKITLPPLRSRPDDIEFVAKNVLDRINAHFAQSGSGYQHKSLAQDAIDALRRRQWPGNIRELESLLKQISVFMDGKEITAKEVDYFAPELSKPMRPASLLDRASGTRVDLEQCLGKIRLHFVENAMREGGSQKEAAVLLGISQQQVSKVLKEAKATTEETPSDDVGFGGKNSDR